MDGKFLLENCSQLELQSLINTGMLPAPFTPDGRYDFETADKIYQKANFGYYTDEPLFQNFW